MVRAQAAGSAPADRQTGKEDANLGRNAPREREAIFIRHCEERSDEAIHRSAYEVTMDCFAEPVIGRAFARPVGSQ
jgi:hypothetical protein